VGILVAVLSRGQRWLSDRVAQVVQKGWPFVVEAMIVVVAGVEEIRNDREVELVVLRRRKEQMLHGSEKVMEGSRVVVLPLVY
jgi:hypothetical protein